MSATTPPLPLPEGFADAVRALIDTTLADQQQLTRELHDGLSKQLAKLEAREQRLIDLAADGLLSRDKILARSNAIQMERVRIQASLTDTTAELAVGADRLQQCLELAADPVRLYAQAPDSTRQQLNATFFEKFYLDDEPLNVLSDQRKPPFDEVAAATATYRRYKQQTVYKSGETKRRLGPQPETSSEPVTPVLADLFTVSVSSTRVMVELRGFEPLTPSMRTRCATGLRYSPWNFS